MKTVVFALTFVAALSCYAQPDSLRHLDALCGNDRHLPSKFDSLYGPWPFLSGSATRAVISPDRKLLAFYFVHLDRQMSDGVQIYDLENRGMLAFIPGQLGSQWHPFERKLLTAHYVYDLDTDEFLNLPLQVNGRSYWSPDGKYIYYQTGVGKNALLRSTPDGGNMEYLENVRMYSWPLTDSTFFSWIKDGYEITNLRSGDKVSFISDWMRELNPRSINNISISRAGEFVLADFWESESNRWNDKKCLGMVDLRTNMFKKVLPSQRLGNEYYPSWTPNGTIIISYVCRSDSVYAIWEIDTNGVFLRQLIGRDEMEIAVSADSPEPALSRPEIKSVYPHPGRGTLTIELDMPAGERASLSLMDLSGRKLRTVELSSSGAVKVALPVAGIPPGFYLIAVKPARGAPVYRSVMLE